MFDEDQDIKAIQEAIKALCLKFPNEYWREKDRTRTYPTEFVKSLSNQGYLGCLIPEEYGGSGLSLRAAAVILEEIHYSGGNGAACHAQMYIMGTLLRHGSDEQKKRYLPGIADGRLRLQAFGVTEPSSGTDTLALKTTARKDGDFYIINGQKVWTSRAEHSDLMLLLARTTHREKVEKRTDGLSVFIVDMRNANGNGLTIRPIRTMINHATTEVFFDDLRVPRENLIGEEGKGFPYIMQHFALERLIMGINAHARAEFAVDYAIDYMKERTAFGKSLDKFQALRHKIAEMASEVEMCKEFNYSITKRLNDGDYVVKEASMSKLLSTKMADEVIYDALQLLGGYGYMEDYPMARLLRDSRLGPIGGGTSEILKEIIAKMIIDGKEYKPAT